MTPPSLKILGEVDTVIENKTKFLESKFFVAETKNINLLAAVTSLALGLIKIDKSEHMCFIINNKKNGNAQKEETKANETRTYPERLQNIIEKHKKRVFQNNIGKIKDYSVKLHIDPSVPPVVQRERWIPFALRDKVNEELKQLEKEGIIEDVTEEPTSWLNPLVIVPTGEDNIRICVDMRAANKAITRTRYPTPTVDDLLVKLKDSKFFPKLDTVPAFRQIELDQDSRFITGF